MAMFVLEDATGIGSDDLDPLAAFVDLVIIADDDGVGLDDPAGGLQQVSYNQTVSGAPQDRLNTLVNTTFSPDYGGGAQNVDILVIAGLSGFTLDDGTSFANNGTALPPASSGLAGASLNTTENCLVIYDTQQNICVAREGTDGDIDLPISNPVVLYHEFSHAFRIVNNNLLELTADCDPASPEENAAIIDENDLRTQIANRQGETPELRDPDIHCGQVGCNSGCCIIATVASKSLNSRQVQYLRAIRDHFVRSTEVGFAFFEQFFRDYYSFSPQVCTLMAGHPEVTRHLLEGYINPLLEFWQIMIKRAHSKMNQTELGEAFAALQLSRKQSEARMQALQKTASYWQEDVSQFEGVPKELLTLLQERAWPSEYIQWALVAPVRIYVALLHAYLKGGNPDLLGQIFDQAIAKWVPEFPLSSVWGSFSAEELVNELEFCHNALLQTEANKQRLNQRLLARFQDITAIRRVIGAMAY